MSSIYHEAFVPYDFGTQWLRDEQADESDLLRVTPSNSEREQRHQKTISLSYDAVTFQHLSGIARLFSPAFVNHGEDGDTSGVAAIIEGLPSITFALPDLQISLHFVAPEGNSIETHDRDTSADLRPFMDAVPDAIKITWMETLMWRLDADGKIIERWPGPVPVTLLQELGVVRLNQTQ